MLSDDLVERILQRIPGLTIGVLGDLFLDRYLDLDDRLTEPSLETGLPAYQVVRVRPSPGAAGTIINNLVALGVKRVWPLAVIGDDGEGFELRQALTQSGVVEGRGLFSDPSRRTPTYTKPMLHIPGLPARELNRLDIKNRTPLPASREKEVLSTLAEVWPALDALLVLDQVSEAECGVVTTRVRELLAALGAANPDKVILADSRERIGLFRAVTVKPNRTECLEAVPGMDHLEDAVQTLARRTGRPVFCTAGQDGIVLADARMGATTVVPGYPVRGPIDIVGAGDSTSAGIACALATGASLAEAGAFGNLVASITIQQLGTTGTASPEQVRLRWREVRTQPKT
jgi:bifunctional ADP-heptose synthase (sugar kinase/adenylyltransferase)